MRYGLLADIHGNLDALQAALPALERHGVAHYLVAGDLVGYGPYPNECVAAVAALPATCVAGNHDLMALGALTDRDCIEMARQSMRWTRSVLGTDERAFLASLPRTATAPQGVVMAHGTLDDPEEPTTTTAMARDQLARIEDRHGARILVLGHTHRPLAIARHAGALPTRRATRLPPGDAVLINPGSVGQSRELRLRVRFGVLDLDVGEVSFFAVPYDAAACRAALRRAGLPPASCHLRPSMAQAAARVVRDSAGRRPRAGIAPRRRR